MAAPKRDAKTLPVSSIASISKQALAPIPAAPTPVKKNFFRSDDSSPWTADDEMAFSQMLSRSMPMETDIFKADINAKLSARRSEAQASQPQPEPALAKRPSAP